MPEVKVYAKGEWVDLRGKDGVTEFIHKEEKLAAEDIKKRLESLKGDKRLDASAIKNLPEGSKTILGGAGTLIHNRLKNLAWSVAGHTIDTDVDINNNNLLNAGFPLTGFKMTDGANGWQVTINTDGALVTTLDNGALLDENNGTILLENGTELLLDKL